MINNIKRFIRNALCGAGIHIWKPVENAQFAHTGKYKCKNCGRREIFPENN